MTYKASDTSEAVFVGRTICADLPQCFFAADEFRFVVRIDRFKRQTTRPQPEKAERSKRFPKDRNAAQTIQTPTIVHIIQNSMTEFVAIADANVK